MKSPPGGSRQLGMGQTTETKACTKQDLLGLRGVSGFGGPGIGLRCSHSKELNPLSHKTNPEREEFEPSIPSYPGYRISRKRTEPDWPRLGPSPEYAPAQLDRQQPTGSNSQLASALASPRRPRIDVPPHRLPEPAVTSLIAHKAGERNGLGLRWRSPNIRRQLIGRSCARGGSPSRHMATGRNARLFVEVSFSDATNGALHLEKVVIPRHGASAS